jgi:hypothetical protein
MEIFVRAMPFGVAAAQLVNGRLLMQDLAHVTTVGELHLLWDSHQSICRSCPTNSIRPSSTAARFTRPTIPTASTSIG